MSAVIVTDSQGRPCINIAQLQIWPGNYNEGDVSAIARSVARFGFRGALRVWVDNIVIAGNHTLQALWSLKARGPLKGEAWPPKGVVEQDGEWFVAFVDCTDMDEPEATAFAIADNRTAQLATQNTKLLTEYLTRTLKLDEGTFHATGYDRDDLDDLLRQLSADAGPAQDEWDGETPGDAQGALRRAESYREKFQVQPGQLWRIGRHRLLCGSAYDTVAVARLMQGQAADLANIDPPYGIGIVKPRGKEKGGKVGGSKPFGSNGDSARKAPTEFVQHGKPSRNSLTQSHEYPQMKGDVVQSNLYPPIEGDDRPFDPALFLEVAPIVILWGANYYAEKLPPSSGWMVWDKREGITCNSFADCELAWTNQKVPARVFHHLWNGLHKGSQHGERRTHPTEKPVALFEEIGRDLCPSGLWYDPFAGSGAQLVAAQRLGATCYAVEIEPLYVGTILERLSRFDLTPELIKE